MKDDMSKERLRKMYTTPRVRDRGDRFRKQLSGMWSCTSRQDPDDPGAFERWQSSPKRVALHSHSCRFR